MKSRKTLKRMKLGKDLSNKRVYELLEARLNISSDRVKHWKYNRVTGWVSVRIK